LAQDVSPHHHRVRPAVCQLDPFDHLPAGARGHTVGGRCNGVGDLSRRLSFGVDDGVGGTGVVTESVATQSPKPGPGVAGQQRAIVGRAQAGRKLVVGRVEPDRDGPLGDESPVLR
jgi:hypothetical protein